mmetsp:Transcript_9199/g.29296  ORF Transcript_9199/g.29296 Transcript_9199/m.29296 type:complete len:234 (+) Transcript_9199:476-1177(+)
MCVRVPVVLPTVVVRVAVPVVLGARKGAARRGEARPNVTLAHLNGQVRHERFEQLLDRREHSRFVRVGACAHHEGADEHAGRLCPKMSRRGRGRVCLGSLVHLRHILQHPWQRRQRTEGRRDGRFTALGGDLQEDAASVTGSLVRLEANEQVDDEREEGIVHSFLSPVGEQDAGGDKEEGDTSRTTSGRPAFDEAWLTTFATDGGSGSRAGQEEDEELKCGSGRESCSKDGAE